MHKLTHHRQSEMPSAGWTTDTEVDHLPYYNARIPRLNISKQWELLRTLKQWVPIALDSYITANANQQSSYYSQTT